MGNFLEFVFSASLLERTVIAYILVVLVPTAIPLIFFRLVGIRGLKTLLSVESHRTVVHHIDPRLKVLYPVAVGTISIFLNWDWVYALFALTLVPWIAVRPSLPRVKLLLTMAIVPAVASVWSQGLYHTTERGLLVQFPWTVAWVGTPGLSLYGMEYGLREAGRLLISVSSSLLLIMTTTPSDVVWALKKFGMPQRGGLAVSVALRFLPQMFERLNSLLQAVAVRGYDFSKPARRYSVREWFEYAWRMIRLLPILAVPLLVGSLSQVSILATVADARAFNLHKQRGSYRTHALHTRDRIAWAYFGFMMGSTLWLIVSQTALRRGFG